MLAVAWETKNHVNFQTMMSFNLPLLKWLGVGFHTRNIKFTYLLVSDIFWWFFNLAMLCLFLRYEFPFLFDGTVNSKKVDRLVGPINYATHTFLIFLGTWWMSRFHGPALWTSLLQIGDHVRISSKDVSYCHRAAKAHLFLIFVGVGSFSIFDRFIWNNELWLIILIMILIQRKWNNNILQAKHVANNTNISIRLL